MLIHSPKELALIVSNERKKQKLSQAAVAKLVGLKQTTVSAFENKPESTKLETLFQILSAIGLDIQIFSKQEDLLRKIKWQKEW